MRNLNIITKRLKIILITVFVMGISGIIIASTIEDFVEFSPRGYEDISRVIMRDGKVLKTSVPEEGEHLQINFKKSRGIYEVHVIYFSSTFTLMNFWYDFVRDYTDGLDVAFSAIPFIYGEFNIEYSKMQLSAWFTGYNNTFFLVYGPKKNYSK